MEGRPTLSVEVLLRLHPHLPADFSCKLRGLQVCFKLCSMATAWDGNCYLKIQSGGQPLSIQYRLLEGTVSLCSCPLKIVAVSDHNCHVLSICICMHKHRSTRPRLVCACWCETDRNINTTPLQFVLSEPFKMPQVLNKLNNKIK